MLVFPLIITGVVLNTIFLVREIRRNEQHEAFINAVTHELKTPVASMKLYLQTLQNRQVDEAKRQEFYGAMLEDSDRLLGTIEQVLRAGQLGARARRASPHADRSQRARRRSAWRWRGTRHQLPPEALTYRETLAERRRPPRARRRRRARRRSSRTWSTTRSSTPGPRCAWPSSSSRRTPAMITLRVRDQGIGISPSERKRIFKRFYRIPGAMPTRVKGTGLGLFIVRSVVARHGGKVFAESEGPGHGSTFTVQLPVVRAAMSRILVVEDEQHLADGLRYNLEAEQHDVDVVDNGEEALAAADRRADAATTSSSWT